MIRSIQQGMTADGVSVPLTKLCRWFDVPIIGTASFKSLDARESVY